MCSGAQLVAIFALLLTAFSSTARADAFADARAVYDTGNFTAARALFLPLAEKGDREAQTMMGHLARKGERTYNEGAAWYLKAAQQGEPIAQFLMAVIDMKRAPDSQAAALDWLRKSAEQDFGPAQWALSSVLTIKNNGAPNDEAFKWTRRAADFDNESGPAERLAKWYATGAAVEKNIEEAYFWGKISEKAVFGWKDGKRKSERLEALANNEFAPAKLATQLAPAKKAEIDRRVAAWVPKKRPVLRTEESIPKERKSPGED